MFQQHKVIISCAVTGAMNAEQVRQVRGILEGPGLEIASPDEARAILQLKGADRVAF